VLVGKDVDNVEDVVDERMILGVFENDDSDDETAADGGQDNDDEDETTCWQ